MPLTLTKFLALLWLMAADSAAPKGAFGDGFSVSGLDVTKSCCSKMLGGLTGFHGSDWRQRTASSTFCHASNARQGCNRGLHLLCCRMLSQLSIQQGMGGLQGSRGDVLPC